MDASILFAFWLVFYIPIWSGARHVGYDLDGYNYPLDRYIMGGLRSAGHLPTWDWFSYNGIDFAGNIQAAAFYPPKCLFELVLTILHLPLTYPAYQLFALLHVLVFSYTAYFVARSVGIARFWSVCGTLFLAYTGVLQAQIQHLWFIAALPWLPLIVYGAYRAAVERRPSGVYTYILASIGLSLLGYPLQYLTIQVEVLALVVFARLYSFRSASLRTFVESVFGFIVCQVVVMLVSASSIFPFLALEKNSIADALAGPVPLAAAWTIVLPNVFGHLSGTYTLAGTDSTVSYFFVGLVLELAIVAAFVARGELAKSSRGVALAGLFLVANAALEFLPLGAWGFWSVPGFGFIRPQTGGMPFALAFASLVTIVLAAADRALVPRLQTTLRIGAVIAVFSLFVNVPGQYSTPSGPAAGVETFAEGFVGGGIPDVMSIVAIDQSTIGGSADNWPRVLGFRTLGGEDPLAQRPYLDLLDSKGLHNSGRRVYFSSDADFSWLQANGVGLVMSSAPSIAALAQKEHWRVVAKPPYAPIYALPSAIPIAQSPCAKAVSVSLGVDEMKIHYESAAPNCSIRLTTNYNESFSADRGASIVPLVGELGMNLSNIPAGTNDVTVSYVNASAVIGRWVSVVSLALIVIWPILLRSTRRRSPA